MTFEEALIELYRRDVRVRVVNGKQTLMVRGSETISEYAKKGIAEHKKRLIKYYADESMLQIELDRIERLIQECKDQSQLPDLYKRYYTIIALRFGNSIKPWEII